ncbi:hypothetical protein CO2235_150166 [Cupriavidus oxalaticus]|uniref:Uncharacterized protein n=1 Tax=Cupriavidus oxalaticus TaxID=96344 RepID=A0A976BAH9_9BURK|nr:hypothetical protein CO2235_150166 [Cupriavidus oxalaticus]
MRKSQAKRAKKSFASECCGNNYPMASQPGAYCGPQPETTPAIRQMQTLPGAARVSAPS